MLQRSAQFLHCSSNDSSSQVKYLGRLHSSIRLGCLPFAFFSAIWFLFFSCPFWLSLFTLTRLLGKYILKHYLGIMIWLINFISFKGLQISYCDFLFQLISISSKVSKFLIAIFYFCRHHQICFRKRIFWLQPSWRSMPSFFLCLFNWILQDSELLMIVLVSTFADQR